MPKLSNTKQAGLRAVSFPVIGIGASAGGLEAYKNLLKTIPEKSGMAFVLVQHLDPTHESLLPDILSRVTPVPVELITNNVRLTPDHIYMIPANKLVVAAGGVLQLQPRPADEKNRPIDVFFSSLASTYNEHAVGILLSGTGTDGTAGLTSIKENGGVTFCQDAASALYNHMPQSAIDAGVVDFVLSPENMMEQLIGLGSGQTATRGQKESKVVPLQDEETLREILTLLRTRRQVDFGDYKKNTIRRRIARRMVMHSVRNPADYLNLLKTDTGELDLLFDDLLITVTEFLRDRKPFAELKNTVFPLLVKGKSISEPLRIWVAGCATGEEAYSIAISLREFLGNEGVRIKIQLYATDISQKAIAVARAGIYTVKQLEIFSAEQLKKFFTRIDGHYQVVKFIRDFCVFAPHNFLADPPFARLDLISCRNVLIYMEPVLQQKVFDMFHYALKEHGFLLLGKSETAAGAAGLFAPFNKTQKIYAKKEGHSHFLHTAFITHREVGMEAVKVGHIAENKKPDLQKIADDILLRDYTPAGVVVNGEAEIVHFRGDTSRFLAPPAGRPTANLLKMARPGLAFELRTAIHKAKTSGSVVTKESVPVEYNGIRQRVTIKIIPLLRTEEPHFLILFQEIVLVNGSAGEKQRSHGKKELHEPDPKDLHIRQLELELGQSREDMRIITEDQEAFNEELQSANEELLSGSEELQSLNEELETSKEEIESSNEELMIVNQELLESNIRINDAKKYSDSIIATIHEPFMILNKDLIVRHANRPFYKAFHAKQEQTEGLLLFEMAGSQWDVPELRILLRNTIMGKTTISNIEITLEFESIGVRVLLLNASLIKGEADQERLLLLAMHDITERREAEKKLELLNKALEGKIRHRTEQLEEINKSLDVSNLELQQSNEDLQRFAHVASHDLKEPIRKIKTFSSMLEADPVSTLSENGKIYLDKLQSASTRMLNMVDGVLAYSMINAFEQPTEPVDLQDTIKQIEVDLEVLLQEKGATITCGALPQIEGATVLIYQLFYNLINNSLKFTREGVPQQIGITARKISYGNKEFTEIMVNDTGIGFDQDEAEKIFITFTRLHSKDKYEGTGLGLSLCKKIAQRHGGSIVASGKKGAGTLFTITLPMKQGSDYI